MYLPLISRLWGANLCAQYGEKDETGASAWEDDDDDDEEHEGPQCAQQ